MYRNIINVLQNKNLCIKLVSYCDYTEMHGQQNIKKNWGLQFLDAFETSGK